MDLHRTRLLAACIMRAQLCRLRSRSAGDPDESRRWRQKETWFRGIPEELDWWRDWLLSDEGRRWQMDVVNPQRPIQDHVVARLIDAMPGDAMSILEVGAGPITHLGYTHPGKDIRITPVDPLAAEYGVLLKRAGVRPPIPSIKGDGEGLLQQFERRSYDLAWASNALDHCYDPALVIRNLVAMVKIGHPVVLRHYRNEGVAAQYDGMHQWNFDVRDGELVVWTHDTEQNISRLMQDEARIECFAEDSMSFGAFAHNDWVVCVLTALA